MDEGRAYQKHERCRIARHTTPRDSVKTIHSSSTHVLPPLGKESVQMHPTRMAARMLPMPTSYHPLSFTVGMPVGLLLHVMRS